MNKRLSVRNLVSLGLIGINLVTFASETEASIKVHRYNDGDGIPTLSSEESVPDLKRAQISRAPRPVRHPLAHLKKWVVEIARENLIDPRLVSAVIAHESDWQPMAISPKGAMGLMQLMPKTAHIWGVKDPFNPRENILGGVRYLSHLLNLFDQNIPLALAAYHAGEERVIKDGAIPAIKETRDYVFGVLETYDRN